jgi:hypothetical protein
MTRIFTVLAFLLGVALVATFVLGLVTMFMEDPLVKYELFMVHFTMGLFTAIGVLLVHCIIFTYFLGTGRWVKEVGLAYNLPDANLPRLTRELKRGTFPPALYAMLITIATVAAGAGRQLQMWHWTIHFTLAVLTLLINLWAFRVEYRNLATNARVLDEVLAEVDRIRAEHGLPSNAEALSRES